MYMRYNLPQSRTLFAGFGEDWEYSDFDSSGGGYVENPPTSSGWEIPAPSGGWTDLFKSGMNTVLNYDLAKDRIDVQRQQYPAAPGQVGPASYVPPYLQQPVRVMQSPANNAVVYGIGAVALVGAAYFLLSK